MANKPNTTQDADKAQARNAVAPHQPNSNGEVMIAGRAFKVAKQVTKPVLKQEEMGAVFVTILSAIVVGKELKTKRDGSTDEKPAKVCDVRDLSQGGNAVYTLICSAVVESELKDNYPNDSYVGKSFAIEKLPKREGKRYNDYRIVEVEPIQAAE